MLSFFKSVKKKQAGFSLAEMITVVAIFMIMTAVVLANLPNFRSRTSVDLVAQDIAISIRSAQAYSTATRRSAIPNGDEFPSYGMYITLDDNKTLYLYSVSGEDFTFDPSKIEQQYEVSGNVEIRDIFVDGESQDNTRIVFKRPGTEALIFGADDESASSVVIEIVSNQGEARHITVYINGQITVSNPDSQ